MSKAIFWIASVIYAVIYCLVSYNGPKEPSHVFAGIFGAWLILGPFIYLITHLGKNRKNSSRNTIAFWIATIFFAISTHGAYLTKTYSDTKYVQKRVQQPSRLPQMTEDIASSAVEYLEKTNELVALLIQKNPSFKSKMLGALKDIGNNPAIRRKWENAHAFDISDLESMPSLMAALESEFVKYLRSASDNDIYDMYKTEYAHMVKNNCQVFPIPEIDRQETIRVKSKLVDNSLKNPYKGKLLSDAELGQALKQIGYAYARKGYNSQNLMKFLEGNMSSLSKDEQCKVAKGFYESLLSLPKETCAGVVRRTPQ